MKFDEATNIKQLSNIKTPLGISYDFFAKNLQVAKCGMPLICYCGLHTGVYGEYLSLDGIHSGYNLVLDLN